MSVKEQFEAHFSRQTAWCQSDLERAEFVRSQIPKDVHKVLDVGCGDGMVLSQLHGLECAGVELSEAGVQKVLSLGIPCSQGSLDNLPFRERQFDLVMANEVFEHLSDKLLDAGIGELCRVADKYILVTVPNRDNLAFQREECPRCMSVTVPWGHIRSFSPKDMRALIPGWKLTFIREFGPRIPDGSSAITRMLFFSKWFGNRLDEGDRCPICGFMELQPKGIIGKAFTKGALILSPKIPRWIFALYSR